jgi:hypothetical protein
MACSETDEFFNCFQQVPRCLLANLTRRKTGGQIGLAALTKKKPILIVASTLMVPLETQKVR